MSAFLCCLSYESVELCSHFVRCDVAHCTVIPWSYLESVLLSLLAGYHKKLLTTLCGRIDVQPMTSRSDFRIDLDLDPGFILSTFVTWREGAFRR